MTTSNRTRAILEDLEAVRANLLALSDDIWAGVDRQDLAAFDEGIRLLQFVNQRDPRHASQAPARLSD